MAKDVTEGDIRLGVGVMVDDDNEDEDRMAFDGSWYDEVGENDSNDDDVDGNDDDAYEGGVGSNAGDIGGQGTVDSLSWIRRSMMTLALRKETAESMGRRCTGMDTRSCGPMGDVGESMLYLILGARGLVVS